MSKGHSLKQKESITTNWLENNHDYIVNTIINKSQKRRSRMELRINTTKDMDHLI